MYIDNVKALFIGNMVMSEKLRGIAIVTFVVLLKIIDFAPVKSPFDIMK